MRRFVDGAGRSWGVDINVAQIRRVRDLLKVDLFKLIEDGLKPLAELLADPVRLVDVIFALLMDQAAQQQVTDVQFGQALRGDSLQQAAETFVEELIDFFPETRDRLTLRKVLAKEKEIAQVIAQERDQMIDTMLPEEEARKIVRVLTQKRSSGGAPGSSALTPDPGVSAT